VFKAIVYPISIALIALALLPCCAPLTVQPPAPPLRPHEIDDRVSLFKEQQDHVTAFVSSGRLIAETEDSTSEANTLIIATKNPFKVKIEVTHSWGRDLFHVLVKGEEVHILSFREGRYYSGTIESLGSWQYFPRGMNHNQIWSFVRGYPLLPKFARALSLKGNQITLLNDKDETFQVIDFHPQSPLPRSTVFSQNGAKLHFSHFEKDGTFQYARTVKLADQEAGTTLLLKTKQVIFNQTIPEGIFQLEIPPDYEKHSLTGSP